MSRSFIAIAALLAAFSSDSHACSVCMGDPNSTLAEASNGVFMLLLGLVAVMFIGTTAFAYIIWRKSRTATPQQPS